MTSTILGKSKYILRSTISSAKLVDFLVSLNKEVFFSVFGTDQVKMMKGYRIFLMKFHIYQKVVGEKKKVPFPTEVSIFF